MSTANNSGWPSKGPSRRLRSAGCLLALCLPLFAASPARAALGRYDFDAQEIATMRTQNAEVTEEFERGEAAAIAGRLPEAIDTFRQVWIALPDYGLPLRRSCEAMTAAGRGPEGVPECVRSGQLRRTNLTIRATARALIGGPDLPTIPHLARALELVATARYHAPNHWALSSALCDIAERIGNVALLQRCTEDLVRIAPDLPETRHAVAQLASSCPPARFWAGWLAVAAALAATGGHAARGRWRRRAVRKHAPPAMAAATLVGLRLLLLAGVGHAQNLPRPSEMRADGTISKWSISDTDPEANIPGQADRNKDPLQFGYWLQDLVMKAEASVKHGDHLAAIKYYRAMSKAVPDRAIGFSRLCTEYEAVGDTEKAVASCGAALLVGGVTQGDYAHYVRLVLAKHGSLTAKEKDTLSSVLDSLKADPRAQPLFEELQCAVASRTSDLAKLEQCVSVLATDAPDAPSTIDFQFALALRRGRFVEARAIVERAKKAGFSDGALKDMRDSVAAAQRRHVWSLSLAALAIASLLGGLALVVRQLRRRTPAGPQPLSGAPAVAPPAADA